MAFDGIMKLVKLGFYSALFAGGCYYGNNKGYEKGHNEGYEEAKIHASAIFKNERDEFCSSLEKAAASEFVELERHYAASNKNCLSLKEMLSNEREKPIGISPEIYAELIRPETP